VSLRNEELSPRRPLSLCGPESMLAKDAPDGGSRDAYPEGAKLALDEVSTRILSTCRSYETRSVAARPVRHASR
jgi:hypothetical protein